MKTVKLNFTIPEDIAEVLQSRIDKRKRSAFVAEAVAEKLKKIENEQLVRELKEGYQARRVEDTGINTEWESTGLEEWPEQ